MQINFGGNRTEDALQTLALIANEVMPHFAHIDPPIAKPITLAA
jgi:hypothetical protein